MRIRYCLALFCIVRVFIQSALGIVECLLCLTQRIGSFFFCFGIGADARYGAVIGCLDLIILCLGIVIGILGIIQIILGVVQIVLGIIQILICLLDLILQIDQVVFMLYGRGLQVLHGAVVAGLSALQAVAVALLGRGDLLLQVFGIQHGNHIALFHLIAYGHAHFRNFVVLGRIGHGHTGLTARFYGAVHAHGIGQAVFLQGRGAHKLVAGRRG